MNYQPLKRGIDILGSLLTLAILWPVLILVAVAIRLDSPGPIFFKQERVGRDRTLFFIWKFRSMYHRVDEAVDQTQRRVITDGTDPRITRVGRFLRASSLDELPQLFNILRGDMSLIGPRPLIPAQLAAVPEERLKRFRLRPGLTGLAQVRGRRGLDWLNQLAYDCEYVERCSLWQDILIVLRTLHAVATARGVYGGEGSNWRAYLPSVGKEAS